jgi:uncharacterized membrane protein
MKPFRVALMLGGIILLGALPAAGQQAPPAAPPDAAASGDRSPDHDRYLEKARADLQKWRRDLDDFNARATAEGRADSRAAADQLNAAWAKTQAEAGKLQAAGAEDWDRARASFENSSRDFTQSLGRIWPRHDAPAKP